MAARWVPVDELPTLEMPDRLRSLLVRILSGASDGQHTS
jgi:hypothetical protein